METLTVNGSDLNGYDISNLAVFKEFIPEGMIIVKIEFKDSSFIISYDKEEEIELEFPNEEMLKYMIAAHEAGLSFDAWVRKAIVAAIENE
jgi:hypothetical protein